MKILRSIKYTVQSVLNQSRYILPVLGFFEAAERPSLTEPSQLLKIRELQNSVFYRFIRIPTVADKLWSLRCSDLATKQFSFYANECTYRIPEMASPGLLRLYLSFWSHKVVFLVHFLPLFFLGGSNLDCLYTFGELGVAIDSKRDILKSRDQLKPMEPPPFLAHSALDRKR